MKTQEEYAREIDKIVIRDLDTCRNDWLLQKFRKRRASVLRYDNRTY